MRKLLLCVLCGLMCIPNALAMDLSLKDAVDKIVAESNDLKSAEANIKKAKAQLSAVNANRWMSIDGNVSYMNLINVKDPRNHNGVEIPSDIGAILGSVIPLNEIPDNIFSAGVQITQPIYTFGKIGNAVDAVHDAIDMSKSEVIKY